MSWGKRRFVIRTICNGQVKILGFTFRPSNQWMEYDGRLDGMRFAFGLYYTGDVREPFVYQWGTEAAFRAPYLTSEIAKLNGVEQDENYWPGPECVDDYFPWIFWYAREPEAYITEQHRRMRKMWAVTPSKEERDNAKA